MQFREDQLFANISALCLMSYLLCASSLRFPWFLYLMLQSSAAWVQYIVNSLAKHEAFFTREYLVAALPAINRHSLCLKN